jgi:hypothetical protein
VHGPTLAVYVERLRAELAAAEPLLARDIERQERSGADDE